VEKEDDDEEEEQEEEEEEEGGKFGAMMPIIINVYPRYEKKISVTRAWLKFVARPCTKKELQKLPGQKSILSIEIMKSCLEYIMCNFHWNKSPT